MSCQILKYSIFYGVLQLFISQRIVFQPGTESAGQEGLVLPEPSARRNLADADLMLETKSSKNQETT